MALNRWWEEDGQWNPDTGGSAPPPPPEQALESAVASGFVFPTPGGGGGGGGGGDGLSAKPSFNFQKVPRFTAPLFAAPTFEEAQAEPGYEFRLSSGRDALERSAAARGTLRTGGTLKDILEYGQQFGAQEYSNVFNRALQTYGTKYQGAKDEYAPLLAQWSSQFGAEQMAAMAEFQREWDKYSFRPPSNGMDAILAQILSTPPPAPPA